MTYHLLAEHWWVPRNFWGPSLTRSPWEIGFSQQSTSCDSLRRWVEPHTLWCANGTTWNTTSFSCLWPQWRPSGPSCWQCDGQQSLWLVQALKTECFGWWEEICQAIGNVGMEKACWWWSRSENHMRKDWAMSLSEEWKCACNPMWGIRHLQFGCDMDVQWTWEQYELAKQCNAVFSATKKRDNSSNASNTDNEDTGQADESSKLASVQPITPKTVERTQTCSMIQPPSIHEDDTNLAAIQCSCKQHSQSSCWCQSPQNQLRKNGTLFVWCWHSWVIVHSQGGKTFWLQTLVQQWWQRQGSKDGMPQLQDGCLHASTTADIARMLAAQDAWSQRSRQFGGELHCCKAEVTLEEAVGHIDAMVGCHSILVGVPVLRHQASVPKIDIGFEFSTNVQVLMSCDCPQSQSDVDCGAWKNNAIAF